MKNHTHHARPRRFYSRSNETKRNDRHKACRFFTRKAGLADRLVPLSDSVLVTAGPVLALHRNSSTTDLNSQHYPGRQFLENCRCEHGNTFRLKDAFSIVPIPYCSCTILTFTLFYLILFYAQALGPASGAGTAKKKKKNSGGWWERGGGGGRKETQ